MQVGVLVTGNLTAGGAMAAPFVPSAEYCLDKGEGGLFFAASFNAFKEIGVGYLSRSQRSAEKNNIVFLAEYAGERHF
jgi:hypothetical protein